MIIRINPFSLVFGSITDRDNQASFRSGCLSHKKDQTVDRIKIEYHLRSVSTHQYSPFYEYNQTVGSEQDMIRLCDCLEIALS